MQLAAPHDTSMTLSHIVISFIDLAKPKIFGVPVLLFSFPLVIACYFVA